MNNDDPASLIEHYHQPDLTDLILKVLRDSGLNTDHLECEDLESLDEFHLGGKQATRGMAVLCQLEAGQRVLDLGCGVGGPARFLAREYGCRVSGLELVASYCEAARVLTKLTGLNNLVSFHQGDMRAIPFADASFDCVWSQHTVMNIDDKAALASEMKRVLCPGGRAVIYEVCCGNGDPVHLPVPWASKENHSHLCGADDLRGFFTASGMVEETWKDVTDISLVWFDAMVAGVIKTKPNARPLPGVGLLMGRDAGLKSRNLGKNLREGRVVVVQGVFKKI